MTEEKTEQMKEPSGSPLSRHSCFAGPQLKAAGESHMGLVRKKNEDNYCLIRTRDGKLLVMVADGIGGHSRGEVASYICCREMASDFLKHADGINTPSDAAGFLKKALERINSEINIRNRTSRFLRPMGTTVNCALFCAKSITIANAGDSRAYEAGFSGSIKKLSTDHTFRALPASGSIENRRFTENVIYRALGLHKNVEIEITQHPQVPGSRYLFCTDGMYRSLADKRIAAILLESATPEEAINTFMRAALVAGGKDNITGITVFINGDE